MELLQQKGKQIRQFVLLENGLKVIRYKEHKLLAEEVVPFENIKTDRFYYTLRFHYYLIAAAIFFLVATLTLLQIQKQRSSAFGVLAIWYAISAGFLITYYLRTKRYFLVKTFKGQYLSFSTDDEDALAVFINVLMHKRNDYLRSKYSHLSMYLSYESQYSNLNILQQEGVLSQDAYHKKIAELNQLFGQTRPRQLFFYYSEN